MSLKERGRYEGLTKEVQIKDAKSLVYIRKKKREQEIILLKPGDVTLVGVRTQEQREQWSLFIDAWN